MRAVLYGASNLSNESGNEEDRTKIIAACGLRPNDMRIIIHYSFVGELDRMARDDVGFGKCIFVQRHQRMLASMLHQTLPTDGDPGIVLTSELCSSTPVYTSRNRDATQPSIPVKRHRSKNSVVELYSISLPSAKRC
jgi:hypothetical protein